jgi:uncharacterized membrane protein YhaH (DUF805 family)
MVSTLFGFNGRIGRGGWWLAQFMVLLTWAIIMAVALMLHDPDRTPEKNNDTAFLVTLAVGLVLSVSINVCSTVKRYHDRGKSGVWFFIGFIPFIGAIWQLIECGMLPGDDSDNAYGPPPGSGKSAHRGDNGSTSANGSLGKLDDNYLANYAKQIALQQAQRQAAAAGGFDNTATGKPVFGKR